MTNGLSRVKVTKRYDFILIAIVFLLVSSSLVAIYSSLELLPAFQAGIVKTQFQWVILSLVAVSVILYFGNDALYDFVEIVYWIFLALLIILFLGKILGKFTGFYFPFMRPTNGALSWFQIPGLGSLQPSEFMKIVLVIKVAIVIDEHNQNKQEYSFEEDLQLFFKILKPCFLPLFLILIQPDTGLFIIISISIFAMVVCSGIRKEWFYGCLILGGIVMTIFFYLYYFQYDFLNSFFNGYKFGRFDGWLRVEEYSTHFGQQLYTSLLALGSAGLSGVGLQPHTIQLSEANTDLIFVVFGQTFGLFGSLFLLGLCFGLDYRIYKICARSTNTVEKYMMLGFLGMIVYQQVQNIGMVTGLLPITGITLPFVSYGGSSLLSYFIALGFILNASSRAKKMSDYLYD